MPDEIISLKELSKLIDVSYAKLLRHTEKGMFPDAVLIHDTDWYLPKKHIKLFKENKVDLSGTKNKLEAPIEKQIIKETRKQGHEIVKIQGTKSWPDDLVLLSNGDCFLIEVKREKGGVISAHQKKKHEKIRKLNHKVFVVSSLKQYKRILRGLTE